ncbi:glycosyltransferase [Marmoricola endophyticus]|uniref:glycosyltransferase n=1 Tax=Marmoricola endophyticus TaxID=2040280 RepID=UPI001E3DE032|nr:glycosyltransferase [Marmoricola endophyticus]
MAIAHDYLTQRGGAERVVLAMARAFPGARIHTTFYDPEGTYPEFADLDVVASPLNRVRPLRRDPRRALPVLAPVASRTRVEADVVLSSSSGWAHGFDVRGRRLVYCHAPARWLYQPEAYVGGPLTRSPKGLALLALRRPLRRWDRRAAARADAYLCNSRVVRERIARAYGIDATLAPAPHSFDPTAPQEPVPAIAAWAEEGYDLVVSRLLPYKNVDVAVEAARRTGRRLVVVGDGPERERLLRDLPGHVALLHGLDDAQLRWTYAHARLLVAAGLEDYGLTPLEAAAFGVPTVALGAGGYLDTVVPGVTGVHFDRPEAGPLAAALAEATATRWDHDAVRRHADDFSEAAFARRLHDEVDRVLGS